MSSSISPSDDNTPALTDPASRDTAVNWFGYHPVEFDDTVLCEHAACPERDLEAARPPTPVASLGNLARLPLELLGFVVQYADLRTVSQLRLVNPRMRLVVGDSIPYKFLLCHIPGTIASLRLCDAWQHFVVADLYSLLCTPTCAFCKGFGTYLWILEGVRCCFNCLNETEHIMPLMESDAKSLFGVSKRALAGLPSMLTLPGTYGIVELYYGRRFRLYSQDLVVQAAVTHHGSDDAYKAWLAGDGRKAREAFSRPRRRGVSKSTFYIGARFMAATPLPYFDPTTRQLHRGLVCRGCQIAMIRSRHLMATHTVAMDFIRKQARMWLEDQLFEHLAECKDAQDIWGFMHEARNRPAGNPFAARDGSIASKFLMSLV
ncbi:hypothetical protein C8Q72DRAFT_849723 [Fomitopsis betulina]|nr:hypothetical protein C8Q72DRAFT_849723 [Fomitopsis betulina]